MNENSELRSFVSCSKNFSKNIINKSIKNNIVLINNDGGVKTKRKHRGFTPSTFAVTLSRIKFSLSTKTVFLINTFTNIIFSILINIVTLTCIKFSIYPFFLIIICSLIYIIYLILIYIFSFTVAYILSYIRIRLSLSSSITALLASLLVSSFTLPITVLLKSPIAAL